MSVLALPCMRCESCAARESPQPVYTPIHGVVEATLLAAHARAEVQRFAEIRIAACGAAHHNAAADAVVITPADAAAAGVATSLRAQSPLPQGLKAQRLDGGREMSIRGP